MKALIAGSLPEPTPRTTTSASLTPKAATLPPTTSPTFPAANGVPFFAPLKPRLPELDQNNVLPDLSEKRTLVLLKVASICKTPETTFFFGNFEGAGFTSSTTPSSFFIPVLSFDIFLLYELYNFQSRRYSRLSDYASELTLCLAFF